MNKYEMFVRSHGYPLNKINPGSEEYYLKMEDAICAIEILKAIAIPVRGIDIIVEQGGNIGYAYQIWGSQFHTLNYYIERKDDESFEDFCKRSYSEMEVKIREAFNLAQMRNQKCYIVLNVDND